MSTTSKPTNGKRTLTDIAKEINEYLKVFERDQVVERERLSKYFYAGACRSGRYIRVVYVSYQGGSHLTKQEAETYLAWLREGNVGKHYSALKAGR